MITVMDTIVHSVYSCLVTIRINRLLLEAEVNLLLAQLASLSWCLAPIRSP
jgi:hypothetical protein